tara:strand:- start:19 stop:219 length:201 start_codon:yes stop_codon:yes gene_type:complete
MWTEVLARLKILGSLQEEGDRQGERELLPEAEEASQQGERELVLEVVVASQQGAQEEQKQEAWGPL